MFEFLTGGSIEVKTDKPSYKLGETVNAEFTLKLNKPIKARGLYARLCAYEMRERTSISGDRRHTRHERVELFMQETKLDGEKEYAGTAAYKSSFNIPQDPSLVYKGAAFKAQIFGFSLGAPAKRIYREVTAKLGIPMAIDVSGKAMLNVSE